MKRILVILLLFLCVFSFSVNAMSDADVIENEYTNFEDYEKCTADEDTQLFLPAKMLPFFGTLVHAVYYKVTKYSNYRPATYRFHDHDGREFLLTVDYTELPDDDELFRYEPHKRFFGFNYGKRFYVIGVARGLTADDFACTCPDTENHHIMCRLIGDDTRAGAFADLKLLFSELEPFDINKEDTPKVTTPTATTTTPPPQAPASNPWKYWVAPAGVLLLVGGIACGVYLKRKRKE